MPARRSIQATGVLVLLGVVAAVAWSLLAADEAPAEGSDLQGLQITFAPSGVTFFDERNGDVWVHPYQITGAVGVAHFRVSERGAKLTVVREKK